jgi:PleD family two-component response regulator
LNWSNFRRILGTLWHYWDVGTQKLNLLLVEDSFEDQQMIQEALAEIEECGPRYNWFSSEVVAVDHLADAIHCLDRARFDAVLLDLELPDSPVLLNTFGQVQLASPGTAVIGLVDEQDEPLANRLLREGAQDVLVKREIECAPLAHSLRHAIERQRRARALRSISFFDELSGFYSRWGFISLASHDLAAARATGAPIKMAVLEIEGLPEEPENRDLLLLDVSELLQNAFADATLIGRLDATSFGLVTFRPEESHFLACLDRFHNELQRVRQGLRVMGATVSVPAAGPCDLEQLLEEARPRAGRKTVCCRIDKRSADDRAGHHVQRRA